jgi:hypothetical protein
MSRRIILWVFFSLLCILFGCREEKVYPTIEFAENNPERLVFNDTIEIVFNVRNYTGNVQVAVLDEEGLLPFNVGRLREQEGTFTYEVYTSNRYIASGEYSIRVRASSKNAESSAYAPLDFTGLEKRLLGYACADAAGTVLVSDTNLVFDVFTAYPGCRKLAYNPQLERLFLLKDFDELQATSLPNGANASFRNEVAAVDRGFQQLVQEELSTYLLSRDGYIDVLRASGQQSRRFRVAHGEYAFALSVEEAGVFCLTDFVSNGSLLQNLLFINTTSGNIQRSYALPGRPLALAALGSQQCVVLCEENGKSVLYRFRGSDNTLTKITESPLLFQGVELRNAQEGLLWGTEGIYTFNLNSNLMPVQLSGLPVTSLKAEVLSGNYLLTSGNTLHLFNARSGQSQLLLQRATAVVDGTIIYNK